MPVMAVLFILALVLTTVMTIIHIIHINKSNMSSNDKLMWLLVVLILTWLGDMIYWYVKIWKDEPGKLEKSPYSIPT
jgi:CDP-diglyceride synthetase